MEKFKLNIKRIYRTSDFIYITKWEEMLSTDYIVLNLILCFIIGYASKYFLNNYYNIYVSWITISFIAIILSSLIVFIVILLKPYREERMSLYDFKCYRVETNVGTVSVSKQFFKSKAFIKLLKQKEIEHSTHIQIQQEKAQKHACLTQYYNQVLKERIPKKDVNYKAVYTKDDFYNLGYIIQFNNMLYLYPVEVQKDPTSFKQMLVKIPLPETKMDLESLMDYIYDYYCKQNEDVIVYNKVLNVMKTEVSK